MAWFSFHIFYFELIHRMKWPGCLVAMSGTYQLMAKLLYGCGLRLMECVRLWVKDDVSTTMIYTHVINKGGMGVQSPLHSLS